MIVLFIYLLSGCSSTPRTLYTEGYAGEFSKGINWVNYNDNDWGWTAGFGSRETEEPSSFSGDEVRLGAQFGATRSFGENFGATLGVGSYGKLDLFGSDADSNSGPFLIAGVHYRFGDQYLLGLQHFASENETVLSIGFDDPFIWIVNLFN